MMARPFVRTLSRYLLRRHLAPFGLAITVLTSLMLIQQMAKQLPALLGKRLPSGVIVEVFVLSVPFIVAVTLPMAVLFAVVRVFTRLAADSDITAMNPGGVSVWRLITPVLGGTACVAALSLLWNDQVLPRSNHRLRMLQVEIERNKPSLTTNAAYESDREMTISELRRAARNARADADRAVLDGQQGIERVARQRVATYEVEIQKKYAIAAGCLVFALFGAPVGLRFQRRDVGLVIGVSLAVFTLYYVGLIGGEELGDRLIVAPFLAMWSPNLILVIVGLATLWRIRKRTYAALTDRSPAYRNGKDEVSVSPAPTERESFSKQVGCFHAIAFASVFALAFGAAAAVLSRNPKATGDLAADLLPVVGGVGFLASYLYQKGRRLLAAGVAVVVWVALPLFLFVAVRRNSVTQAETHDLQISPDHIRHLDFGFALPHPGKNFHVVELPSALSEMLASEGVGRETFVWMLRNDDSSEAAMIFVIKSLNVADKQTFHELSDEMRRRLGSVNGAELLGDTLVWEPGVHEFRLGVRLGNGLYGRIRCLASLSAPAVCVCVQTWARRPHGLDFVRSGLAFDAGTSHRVR
jgi:lipopolysaccharide export LptBFGC system permease protein LptF